MKSHTDIEMMPTTETGTDQLGYSDGPSRLYHIMDNFEPRAETVPTEDAFNSVLQNLVQVAHANGVTIEGGWEHRTTTDNLNWEIMILEVAKKTPRGWTLRTAVGNA